MSHYLITGHFFNFTKITVIDYKRRSRLANDLIDWIRPKIEINEGNYFVVPKILDFKYENNAVGFLSLRQVIKSLGKQFRLRLQWIIGYTVFLFVFFACSFFVLIFSDDKTLIAPHYYAVIFCALVTWRIICAIVAAHEANDTATTAIKFTQLQGIEVENELLKSLETLDLTVSKNYKCVEMLKVRARQISKIHQFFKYDDQENPIRILGFRADLNLLKGFLISVFGAAVTFVELAGLT